MDYHEKTEVTAFLNMGAGGDAVKEFTVDGIPDTQVLLGRVVEITGDHVGGLAPTNYEIQIWNKTNADHFANKDDDFEESIYKKTAISPASKAKETEVDFKTLVILNKDTSGARNRFYAGIKLTDGDATTDMALKVAVITREIRGVA